MSYSRWSEQSKWYIYEAPYQVGDPSMRTLAAVYYDIERELGQSIRVPFVPYIYSRRLTPDMLSKSLPVCSVEDLQQLIDCIVQWQRDVEDETNSNPPVIPDSSGRV